MSTNGDNERINLNDLMDRLHAVADNGRPTRDCWTCKCNRWWQGAGGDWICGRCHPDPAMLIAQ